MGQQPAESPVPKRQRTNIAGDLHLGEAGAAEPDTDDVMAEAGSGAGRRRYERRGGAVSNRTVRSTSRICNHNNHTETFDNLIELCYTLWPR